MAKGQYLKVCEGITVVGRASWGGQPAFSGPRATDANIYLLDGGTELALIDCGDGVAWPQIKRNIRAAGYDFRRIKKIILTHCHFDHALGVNPILKELKIPVFAHADDAVPLVKGDPIRIGGLMPGLNLPCPIRKVPVSRRLRNNGSVKVGKMTLKVVHTPGHTPGSMCLRLKLGGKNVLFTGDTVIGDQPGAPKGMFGWVVINYASNLEDLKTSFKRIKALRPDMMLPGHGLPQTKKIPLVMDHCLQRLQKFLDFPGGPYSLMPLAVKATGRIW